MPSTHSVSPSQRVRLVILFGGRSAEHDVSRVSAGNVAHAANPNHYIVDAVGIGRDGVWRRCESIEGGPDGLAIDGTVINPFDLFDSSTADSEVTVVFPVLHGPNGEDGTIQGLLEVAGVPYVGSGVLGSAVSMDKAMAKTILGAHGIAQPSWQSIRKAQVNASEYHALLSSTVDALGDTLFVKPANMGSSIGVSKTHGISELRSAVSIALNYDDVVVVEEAVTAREIETAVLGNEAPQLGAIGEVVAAAEFYDYEDKYRDGTARTIIPADLSPQTEESIRQVAVAAYRALRAEGLARVDLFVDEKNPDVSRRVMVNEINTMPGFTPISMYPQLWKHAGVDYPELIDKLVDLALERHERISQHHLDVISGRGSQ